MGQVLAIMKVMPEDANASLEDLKQRIEKALKEKAEIKAWEEVPIYGPLSVLRMRFIVDDKAGGTEAIEQIVQNTTGVSEIIIEAVSLL